MNKALKEIVDSKLLKAKEGVAECVLSPHGAVKRVRIYSAKPISISEIKWDGVPAAPGEVSDHVPGKAPRLVASFPHLGKPYKSKWNPEREYCWTLDLAAPAIMRNFLIRTDLFTSGSDWLYQAHFEFTTDDGVVETFPYNDGIDWEQGNQPDGALIYRIFYNSCYRKDPKSTFKLLGDAKIELNEDVYVEFEKTLLELIAPYTLNAHGYPRRLEFVDSEVLNSALHEFIGSINSMGYQVFIASGTLLGAVRSGDFIPHDDDVDLGVIFMAETTQELLASIADFEGKLSSSGMMRSERLGFNKSIYHWKLKYAAGVNIDVFPVWIRDNKVFAWPYCFGELDVDKLLPLKEVPIRGSLFPAPAVPIDFLSLNYGVGWRTPDSSFKFNWPAASAKFREFISLVKQRGSLS